MKQPLAFRMRPETLDEVIGQQHLIGPGQVIRRCIEQGPVVFHDLLRAAGDGQNDAGLGAGQRAASALSPVQRRDRE